MRATKSFIKVLIFVMLNSCCYTYAQYTITQIPNPQELNNSFVSDPDHVLSRNSVQTLNNIANEIKSKKGIEYAIVVVKKFKGSDAFIFSYDLFNYWGIGDKEENKGLLLFVATEQRKYQFITGYGVEDVLPDILLSRLANQKLIPYFKAQDYSSGIIQVSEGIRNVLLQSVHAIPEAPPSTGAASPRYYNPRDDDVAPYPIKEPAEQVLPNITEQPPSHALAKHIDDNALFIVIVLILSSITLFYILFQSLRQGFRMDGKVGQTPMGMIALIIFSFVKLVFIIFIVPFIISFISLLFSYLSIQIPQKKFFWITLIYINSVNYIMLKQFLHSLSKNIDDILIEQHIYKKTRIKIAAIAFITPSIFLLYRKLLKAEKFYTSVDGLKSRPERESIPLSEAIELKVLTEYQLTENLHDSINYTVWRNTRTRQTEIEAIHGINYDKFTDCKACSSHTFQDPAIKIIQKPTTTREGKGILQSSCLACGKTTTINNHVIIPRIPPKSSSSYSSSSSSSYSSSSRSSSSSSSSSTSRRGGGRSGGGGAGGSW